MCVLWDMVLFFGDGRIKVKSIGLLTFCGLYIDKSIVYMDFFWDIPIHGGIMSHICGF
jgi:hypothetical protein